MNPYGGYNPYGYQQPYGYPPQQPAYPQQAAYPAAPYGYPPQPMYGMPPRPGVVPGYGAPQMYGNQPQLYQQPAAPMAVQAPPVAAAPPAAPAAAPVAAEQTAAPMNVFVGKLPLEVHDSCVEALLAQCGPVLKWKRTTDADTGAAKAFGFCTFASAEGALQAVKLLHEFSLGDAKILVKVGKKEQAVLDEVVARKQRAARAAAGGVIGAPPTAAAAAARSPADDARLEKLRAFAAAQDLAAPADAALVRAMGGAPAPAAADGPASREQMIAAEMEKFRASQAQRDRELEDERRRKLQAKIQETMRAESAGKGGPEAAGAPRPDAEAPRAKRPRAEPAPTEVAAAPTGLLSGGPKLGFTMKATGRGLGGRGFTPKRPPAAPLAAPASGFGLEREAPRELKVLDYGDEGGAAAAPAGAAAPAAGGEDKRRDRAIAEGIPTDKHALYAADVDWAAVERRGVVNSKLRPWVAKKIAEYLGEEEPTLIDFVCSCLARRANPVEIQTELALVLDEDAEVLVTKLWRVLLFHAAKASLPTDR